MTRLLICAPMGIEARAVGRGLPAGRHTALIRTGIGPGRAARVPPFPSGFDALAVVGFGGALDDALAPGDALVASEVWWGGRRLPCTAAEPLVQILIGRGLHAWTGPLITIGHVVRRAERRRLSRTGARAVDMEAGPLVAAAGSMPVTVIRVIVDTPDRRLLGSATLRGGLAARRTLRHIGPALLTWSDANNPPDTPTVSSTDEGRL